MTEDSVTVLGPWLAALESELGLPAGVVDVSAVLDLARDAAHGVARPAAPLTTYVVGYAAGLATARGAGPDAVDAVFDRAADLALGWRPDATA
jgi:hypothetical protein